MTFDIKISDFTSFNPKDEFFLEFTNNVKSISEETSDKIRECITQCHESLNNDLTINKCKTKNTENSKNGDSLKEIINNSNEITIEEKLPIPVKDIFEYFTKSDKISQCIGNKVDFKLEKNSAFKWLGGEICGKVVDFDEFNFVEFEFKFSDWENFSNVKISFNSSSTNQTDLKIHHTNLHPKKHDKAGAFWNDIFIKKFKTNFII